VALMATAMEDAVEEEAEEEDEAIVTPVCPEH
jgi:hypothetical protein